MLEQVEVAGVTHAFKRTGSGDPLLLLHGAESNHSMYDDLGAFLSKHYTVIAVDQRDSGATLNSTLPYGLDDLADDVASLIPALGYGRAHVLGSSLGSAIAQVLATRHPKKLGKLILSSPFRVGMPLNQINPDAASKIAELRSKLPASVHQFIAYFFPDEFVVRNPEVLRLFTANNRTDEQRRRRAAIMSKQVACDPRTIEAEVLVLAGSEDRLIPAAHTLSLAKEIARCKSVLLPGIGHVGAMQAPAQLASEVIGFLRS